MSSGRPEAQPVPDSSAATVESLQAQNEKLRQENELLRRRLEEERLLRQSTDAVDSHKAFEAAACKDQIRAIDENAEVLALHAELLQLRQTCAVYAEATEESRSYFFELKRLYAELEKHLKSESQ